MTISEIKNDLRHEFCPACKSNVTFLKGIIKFEHPIYYSTTQVKLKNSSELWECEQCMSSFIQNSVHEKDAIKLYSEGSSQERWTKLTFEKSRTKSVISSLTSYLSPGLKILDVGCGSGNFLDFAKKKKCKTYGVEYSISSREHITQKGHISCSSLLDINETFDIITAFDVIEHIYDVPLFLNACKSRLASGGYLILLTGDISCISSKISRSNWWYVKYPEHIVFPSKKYFIDYSGFQLEEWIRIYHSPDAQVNLLKCTAKTILNLIRNKRYNGSPSFVYDHCLIILKL
jgi:SAM-dependent methyltransferase